MDPAEDVYLFGPFRLAVGGRTLMKDGAALPLGGRAFDVLVRLVQRHGALAGKSELLDEVWPGLAVEENNLTTQVLNLRKLLAAHDPGTQYIVTDQGRGYRFVAPIARDGGARDVPVAVVAQETGAAARERQNLPAEPNIFVGRAKELTDIVERLDQRTLVTLVGSGGVGKTRCAVRAAQGQVDRFADGVWLVELAPMQDGALVAEAVCRVIGAPVSGERAAVDVAVSFLRQRCLLLVLDNCEHVLAAAAVLAACLLKQCPGVKILATSRQPLGIDGEAVYRVPSLPLPGGEGRMTAAAALQFDAVRLFVARAADAAGGYVLTDEDAGAVVTICRRLDGVAMATELAAARLRILKPAEIAARLENVFRLLTGGSKAALPRQQTLRATIDWSYALLAPAERTLLRRLAVFVDGFSLPGAEAVGAGEGIEAFEVLDLLTELVDKSLVNAETGGAATRYRMLETTRHYAREKLAESGERGTFRRMAEYLAGFYARGETIWGVTATDVWLAEFGPEVENLRAAIDWAFGQAPRAEGVADEAGDVALGIGLVAVAGSVAEEMSLLADLRRWTSIAAKQLTPETPPAYVGWILYWSSRHVSSFGVDEVSHVRKQMIDAFRRSDSRIGLACALRNTGLAIARPGSDGGEAFDMLTEAVAILRPFGPSKDLATALANFGGYYYIKNQQAMAEELSEEALAIRESLGDRTGLVVSFINLGEFAFVRGDMDKAVSYASSATETARDCNLLEPLATALSNLSNYHLARDDLPQGRAAAVEALKLHRLLGNDDHAAICLEHLALARCLSGDAGAAARLLGFTDSHFERTRQRREPSEALRYERLKALLSKAYSDSMLSALMGEGQAWKAEDADFVAFA